MTYDGLTQQFNKNKQLNEQQKELIPLFCGGMAGLSYQVGIYPIDTIKSKMQYTNSQTGQYKGFIDCYKKTVNNGFNQLYKGVQIASMRGFLTNAGAFYVYEKIKKQIEKNCGNNKTY
ncbi:Mitochondrial carrier domain [Pseudocohnilembus persalinus]|uniref:Mitochondrial carrier domain n=1 Tax=Pseudocohnilembus persalinus TaxID=266149 RepID=A0A0V0QMG0_PSEPJ|nr:Mitochondrial carrier domain [Pseudocohnilembus persalinus]|eukprot:KRX03438.1 Mitochondrial carrier domain [Pseudocohnilembus persalinus]